MHLGCAGRTVVPCACAAVTRACPRRLSSGPAPSSGSRGGQKVPARRGCHTLTPPGARPRSGPLHEHPAGHGPSRPNPATDPSFRPAAGAALPVGTPSPSRVTRLSPAVAPSPMSLSAGPLLHVAHCKAPEGDLRVPRPVASCCSQTSWDAAPRDMAPTAAPSPVPSSLPAAASGSLSSPSPSPAALQRQPRSFSPASARTAQNLSSFKASDSAHHQMSPAPTAPPRSSEMQELTAAPCRSRRPHSPLAPVSLPNPTFTPSANPVPLPSKRVPDLAP